MPNFSSSACGARGGGEGRASGGEAQTENNCNVGHAQSSCETSPLPPASAPAPSRRPRLQRMQLPWEPAQLLELGRTRRPRRIEKKTQFPLAQADLIRLPVVEHSVWQPCGRSGTGSDACSALQACHYCQWQCARERERETSYDESSILLSAGCGTRPSLGRLNASSALLSRGQSCTAF